MTRLAVVLFNLGGPDSLQSVQPFLFNLFNDSAIIGAPAPLRWCLAKFISLRRSPVAQEIYSNIGGKSPLLEETQRQAQELEKSLSRVSAFDTTRVFVCMRYWHPMSDEVAGAVKAFEPDTIILLPLYPQYSATTTGSSLKDWKRAAAQVKITAETRAICCYPLNDGWIQAQAQLIRSTLQRNSVTDLNTVRVLFSAHGLPKKIIRSGDPYQWQVEKTAEAVVKQMGESKEYPTIRNWQVCYQSRVGPLEWIGPSTEDELIRAAKEKISVIIVPIAFVSEHSETLVELDIEYREVANKLGVPKYLRVPAVSTHPSFVDGLKLLVDNALVRQDLASCGIGDGVRICPSTSTNCPIDGPK